MISNSTAKTSFKFLESFFIHRRKHEDIFKMFWYNKLIYKEFYCVIVLTVFYVLHCRKCLYLICWHMSFLYWPACSNWLIKLIICRREIVSIQPFFALKPQNFPTTISSLSASLLWYNVDIIFFILFPSFALPFTLFS